MRLLITIAVFLLSRVEGILVHEPHGELITPAREFKAFMQEHGRSYIESSAEYHKRFALFQDHRAAVHAQNQVPGRRWNAGINALADRTPQELNRLRGYRHGARPVGSSSGSLSLIGTAILATDLAKLPKDFDWKHLNAMKDIMNQGGCGSCWAVAAATTLRAHTELYNKDRTFSVQQIVACTPNPQHCGGTGGCNGATAELAMDYVAKVGSVTEDEMRYKASNTDCPSDMKLKEAPQKNLRSNSDAFALPDVSSRGGGGAFGMMGWKKLPENLAEPLLLALYQDGPVTVSVAASAVWNLYADGIMDACDKGAIINHAVVLVGYGEQSATKYWTIQNSWGPDWGEQGFGRLRRLDSKEETGYCGWDTKPEEGTACKNGPKKVWVCGNCGILYDSVVPKFQLSKEGWLYRENVRNITAEQA